MIKKSIHGTRILETKILKCYYKLMNSRKSRHTRELLHFFLPFLISHRICQCLDKRLDAEKSKYFSAQKYIIKKRQIFINKNLKYSFSSIPRGLIIHW